jgi:hypothetical protein
VPQPAIVRDVLPNGLRLLTEQMPHVRSVSIGVWLARGSRHEPQEQSGIAHFVEHMLFKGTGTRSAEDIAQTIDSIGGQMDAFTAKEYASYYIKVLDEHLPLAIDILSDIVRNPAFSPDDLEREQKFRGAVGGRLLGDDARRDDREGGRELIAERLAQIAHRVEVGHAAAVNPVEDLATAKCRHAERLDGAFEFGALQRVQRGGSCLHESL